MMSGNATRFAALLLCLFGGVLVYQYLNLAPKDGLTPLPRYGGPVTDAADWLSEQERAQLAERVDSVRTQKGAELAVVIIESLLDESIEEYALRLFNTWKLGQKGKDNGVLLVVSRLDRQLRIEVGYGLEGSLTDSRAARIINQIIVPAFKLGDYARGLEEGVQAIKEVLEGGSGPPPPRRPAIDFSSFRYTPSDLFWANYILGGALVTVSLLAWMICAIPAALLQGRWRKTLVLLVIVTLALLPLYFWLQAETFSNSLQVDATLPKWLESVARYLPPVYSITFMFLGIAWLFVCILLILGAAAIPLSLLPRKLSRRILRGITFACFAAWFVMGDSGHFFIRGFLAPVIVAFILGFALEGGGGGGRISGSGGFSSGSRRSSSRSSFGGGGRSGGGGASGRW